MIDALINDDVSALQEWCSRQPANFDATVLMQSALDHRAKECAIYILNTYPQTEICIADTGFDSDVFDRAKCGMMIVDMNSRNKDGKSILHVALECETIDKDFIYRLIDEGVDVDIVDAEGVTPRMLMKQKNIPLASFCILL